MGRPAAAPASFGQLGLAAAAGLLAVVSPECALPALFAVGLALFARGALDVAADRSVLVGLAVVALGGVVYGASGAISIALVWRAAAEIAGSPETQGLTEPPWLAIAYRWAPLGAALLHQLNAPDVLATPALAAAGLVLADWSLRRLAEWRLGEPQPYDTRAYLTSQAQVLAIVLFMPAQEGAVAALVALAFARVWEQGARPSRYAAV
jgi:hypothetical protein